MSYHLTWNAERHPNGIAKEQVPEGHGACDSMLIASIIGELGNERPVSIQFWSAMGTGKDPHATLDAHALFEVWSMLAKNLAEDDDLGDGLRMLAELVFDSVRAAKLGLTSPFARLHTLIDAASKLAAHWTAQDGVNGAVIDEVVAAVNALGKTTS